MGMTAWVRDFDSQMPFSPVIKMGVPRYDNSAGGPLTILHVSQIADVSPVLIIPGQVKEQISHRFDAEPLKLLRDRWSYTLEILYTVIETAR
jgi:hypothetical protein